MSFFVYLFGMRLIKTYSLLDVEKRKRVTDARLKGHHAGSARVHGHQKSHDVNCFHSPLSESLLGFRVKLNILVFRKCPGLAM